MQHKLVKLLLGAFFALVSVGSSFAASSVPRDEDSVPLVKDILNGAVPKDMNSLKIDAAELFQLGFAKDAQLLESYGERSAFLHLLNRPYTPAATVREALRQEVNAKVSLDQLRTDFMHEGYSIQVNTKVDQEGPKPNLTGVSSMRPGVELLPLQPGLWGAFDPEVTHSTGHTIRDAYNLFVWMQIRNHTAESGQFTLAVPIAGPNPMRCKFNTVEAGGTGLTYCVVYMEAASSTKERMIAALRPMLDGHPLSVASSYQFSSDNYPNPVTSATPPRRVTPEEQFGDAWEVAKHNIANAGCEKLGTCVGVFKGYMTNGGLWGMAITAVFMVLTLCGRWFGDGDQNIGRFFSWFFWGYFVLVALAGFFFYVDPPNGTSGLYPGLFSVISAAVVSMPWSFFMHALKDAVPYRALRNLGEHDFAWWWFFIFVNMTYLGLMAFSRRSRR